MNNSKLRPCPDSPNCVSSQAGSGRQFVDPLPYTGPADEAFAKFKKVVSGFPGTRVVQSEEHYLQVEFVTRWMRFTDDLEAALDPQGSVIHVRSASRIGYWDFGTNRKRVEAIRAEFEKN